MTRRAGGGRLRPADRVRFSRDFRRISREGARVAGPKLVILVAPMPGRERGRRLGVTVGRRVGTAVARNRVKRAIREWFRTRRELFPQGIDVVVIARPAAGKVTGKELESELRELATKIPRGVARV